MPIRAEDSNRTLPIRDWHSSQPTWARSTQVPQFSRGRHSGLRRIEPERLREPRRP